MKADDEKICPYCREPFVPSRYRPDQRVCSQPACQRRRRREYHRRKQQTDPLYRQVCLDSQQKWRARHPEYQKSYRLKHPESVQRNREAQRGRDQRRRLAHLVKNNLAWELKTLPGPLWLVGGPVGDLEKNNVALSQVTILQPLGRSGGGPPTA